MGRLKLKLPAIGEPSSVQNSRLAGARMEMRRKGAKAYPLSDEVAEIEEGLEELSDMLEEASSKAREIERIARKAGGEISRVVGGQLDLYLRPTLNRFVDDEGQPGSVASLHRFLEGGEWEDNEDDGEEKFVPGKRV